MRQPIRSLNRLTPLNFPQPSAFFSLTNNAPSSLLLLLLFRHISESSPYLLSPRVSSSLLSCPFNSLAGHIKGRSGDQSWEHSSSLTLFPRIQVWRGLGACRRRAVSSGQSSWHHIPARTLCGPTRADVSWVHRFMLGWMLVLLPYVRAWSKVGVRAAWR